MVQALLRILPFSPANVVCWRNGLEPDSSLLHHSASLSTSSCQSCHDGGVAQSRRDIENIREAVKNQLTVLPIYDVILAHMGGVDGESVVFAAVFVVLALQMAEALELGDEVGVVVGAECMAEVDALHKQMMLVSADVCMQTPSCQ
jgi:hypothetical protein